MKRVLALLAISTVLAVASGCAGNSGPLTVHREYSRCPRPQMPDLPELNPNEHLCSVANLDALLELVSAHRWMIDQQAATIDCYEAQAAGAGK